MTSVGFAFLHCEQTCLPAVRRDNEAVGTRTPVQRPRRRNRLKWFLFFLLI